MKPLLRLLPPISLGVCLLALASCSVGPDYVTPTAAVPASFKEQQGWKPAQPGDEASRGPWWSIYNDPLLNDLEGRIDISNQTLKAAEAAFRAARATVDQARAGFFPTLTLGASGQRSKRGSGSSASFIRQTSTGTTSTGASNEAQNQYSLSGGVSWDIDVWGRIRRTVEASSATADASAADLASARLSAQSELATDYFELRSQDEMKRLLDDAVVDYQRALEITTNQYKAGVAGKADVMSAQTQLQSTQSQALNAGVSRAQLEHAIAVLVGKQPAEFSIAVAPLTNDVPVAPTGVPSTLLERRPDIASAERKAAAANAQIGVAVAAYYPDLTLSGSYGYTSSTLSKLFTVSNRVWSFGPDLAETLFDGGAREAQVDIARATYQQDVATYRQTVLTGFQQVEDELAALRILEQQAGVENTAVDSAREAERLTLNQYKAGTVPYSSVITAQTAALSNEQTALTVRRARLVASVALVEALGGGWEKSEIQKTRDAPDDTPTLIQ